MTESLKADLEEIERGIKILSQEANPDQKRIDFWRSIKVKIAEEIARKKQA
jgi:hypothetical protein